MKNPLRKRYLRDLKQDAGKYLVIFLFMVMLISLVSGYLVAADSVKTTYYDGYEKYNIEDGHMTFSSKPEESLFKEIENIGKLQLYDLSYTEEDLSGHEALIRIYKNRTKVNLECLAEGEMPDSKNEIAIDRVFALNSNINVGDKICFGEKEFKVSGFIALPDYSCLFENNSDMMFSSTTFGVAIVSEEAFEYLDSKHIKYNYAWKYNDSPENETEENSKSEDLIDDLKEIIETYDKEIFMETMDEDKLISIDSYIPRYQNKAITYCMDDMDSDKPSFIIFDYLVTVILAFIFAVTISNTISSEASVIGTLRASGYTKSELVKHYLFMPTMVSLVAAVIGNILGYTVFVNYMKNVFYNSFSLANYESFFNLDAFLITTVIPLCLMIVINLIMLINKLKLPTIKFLRKDLKLKVKRRAMLLNKKIPFILRFRLRILFQNIPAYITMFIGIWFAGAIAVFGFMFGPLLVDFGKLIVEEKICDYQYILESQEETKTSGAEKYCITGLDSMVEGYITDEISIYGIEEDSLYITQDIPKGEVLVSEGTAAKFGIENGDEFTLKDPYSDKTYTFIVAGSYPYSASLAIFINRDDFNETFDKDENYFTGYFSNEQIKDIDKDKIASTITDADLTKVMDQMIKSMGSFMNLFKYFGLIMLLFMMYLLTKQLIEKNMQSIAMTKILGFLNGEIGALYLVITSFVVIAALLSSIPVTDLILRWLFHSYMYKEMSGYIPYIVSPICYVYECLLGFGAYIFVCILMMFKIKKINKSEALKIME